MRGSQVADDRRPEGDGSPRDQPLRDATELPVEGEAPDWSSWSNLWQIPAILISAVIIGIGLYVTMQRAPENDFNGALDQVDRLIVAENFDTAAAQLNQVIEPNLGQATQSQQARFDATVADWIALSQAAADLDLESNNRRIVEHYTRATDLGLTLEPARLERWAGAWISLGDLDAARVQLAELQARASAAGAGLEVRRRRNRVLRRIVEASLRQPDLSDESMMEMLTGYRADPMLSPVDELWAIARQAELRIEAGRAEEAVAHLLIDMRRFEPKLEADPELNFGELYVLLARGYYELGNFPYAEYHVERAVALVRPTDPVRGDALVLLGQITVAAGQWHEAFEFFDEVVRDFSSTASAVPGRLGRAEVFSVLGDDEHSLADYKTLHGALAGGGPRRDVTPNDVARSLSDRHDAALTMGKLEAALQYVLLAESFFESGHVPAEIFFRIGSTSRQLADNQLADARRQSGVELDQLDPQVRYRANEHYRRAGEYFVNHARSLAGRPGADEQWADSLWKAADSYDLGGWHDLAITHFTEYIAGRSEADPRRPDAVFRLAQCYHAELDCESAVIYYDQVLTDHPRSHVASRSHVPLARCLLALGRRPEAEQQMLQVISGQQHLEPDAVDYRDALIELGSLYYDDGDYVRAVERLDEAVRRYPGDPRLAEIQFRLADSYRRHAAELQGELRSPGLAPAERDRLESQRADHLRTAKTLFAAIADGDDATVPTGQRKISDQLLRYSYLYRADSAFELGEFAEAVEYYDKVAGRFPTHHSSMTALIQIVNCYSNLGDVGRARTAHRRALTRLKKLPDEAFEAPDALLDRNAWERWLENMPVDNTKTAAATG